MKVSVQRWAAWTPNCTNREAWEAWARNPGVLGFEGKPEAEFLPAMLRRRCSRLTRMILQAAFEACAPQDLSQVRTVFASRHGAIHIAVQIIDTIVKGQIVSPMQFSHSVHNAQAGLFSIATGNCQASSSLAAEEDTFGHAFLEAMLHLQRSPMQPVLVVMGDEPLPPLFKHLIEEPEVAYAFGMLLTSDGVSRPGGMNLDFALEIGDLPLPKLAWPQALEFLRWLVLGAQGRLVLGAGSRRWVWQRATP